MMNDPADVIASRNASGSITAAASLHGIFPASGVESLSSASARAGGSTIAQAITPPHAHSSVSAIQPAAKPHLLTMAPPATMSAASAIT